MRLVNARTLRVEEYVGDDIPPYAILSHTWGKDEVTYQAMSDPSKCNKSGMTKIKKSCEQALLDKIDYVWVDTCCIDKTSSAELSEAINSMFQWYKESQVCYAYLADVPPDTEVKAFDSAFSQSRWFTRGWTLQELIAPSQVRFYSSTWTLLGTRPDLCKAISSITSIRENFLMGDDLSKASISERMSWASKRKTTREEDIAYCLLGIFGINMPLLYGEGKRAFIRLQEEIMNVSNDESLFAWGTGETHRLQISDLYGLLAESPANFAAAADVVPNLYLAHESGFRVTNSGVKIKLRFCDAVLANGQRSLHAILNCHRRHDPFHFLAIPVYLQPVGDDTYGRLGKNRPFSVAQKHFFETLPRKIYMQKTGQATMGRSHISQHDVVVRLLPDSAASMTQVKHPNCFWDPKQGILTSYEPARFSLAFALLSPFAYAFCRGRQFQNPFVRSQLNAAMTFRLSSGLSFTLTVERKYMSWNSSTLTLALSDSDGARENQIKCRSFPRRPGKTVDLLVQEKDRERRLYNTENDIENQNMKAYVRTEYLRFGSKNIWLVDVGAYDGENPWEASESSYRSSKNNQPITVRSLRRTDILSLGEMVLQFLARLGESNLADLVTAYQTN